MSQNRQKLPYLRRIPARMSSIVEDEDHIQHKGIQRIKEQIAAVPLGIEQKRIGTLSTRLAKLGGATSKVSTLGGYKKDSFPTTTNSSSSMEDINHRVIWSNAAFCPDMKRDGSISAESRSAGDCQSTSSTERFEDCSSRRGKLLTSNEHWKLNCQNGSSCSDLGTPMSSLFFSPYEEKSAFQSTPCILSTQGRKWFTPMNTELNASFQTTKKSLFRSPQHHVMQHPEPSGFKLLSAAPNLEGGMDSSKMSRHEISLMGVIMSSQKLEDETKFNTSITPHQSSDSHLMPSSTQKRGDETDFRISTNKIADHQELGSVQKLEDEIDFRTPLKEISFQCAASSCIQELDNKTGLSVNVVTSMAKAGTVTTEVPAPKSYLVRSNLDKHPGEHWVHAPDFDMESSVAKVETDLEDELEHQLEEELRKEILVLGQRLAGLQVQKASKQMKELKENNSSLCSRVALRLTNNLRENKLQAQKKKSKGKAVSAKFLQTSCSQVGPLEKTHRKESSMQKLTRKCEKSKPMVARDLEETGPKMNKGPKFGSNIVCPLLNGRGMLSSAQDCPERYNWAKNLRSSTSLTAKTASSKVSALREDTYNGSTELTDQDKIGCYSGSEKQTDQQKTPQGIRSRYNQDMHRFSRMKPTEIRNGQKRGKIGLDEKGLVRTVSTYAQRGFHTKIVPSRFLDTPIGDSRHARINKRFPRHGDPKAVGVKKNVNTVLHESTVFDVFSALKERKEDFTVNQDDW